MLKSVEKTGKTVEEAIALAVEELGVNKESIDIEILDEGNKGLFGLIGTKQAKVLVTVKENNSDIEVEKFLKNIFDEMEMDVDIEINENGKDMNINLKGNNMGRLIGRRGETLDALQYITSIVANKGQENYKRVIIDTENYRKKREETLIRLANRVAERVVRLKKSVTLEPMNPYERRIIHSALQLNKQIETYSVGDDPNRKVVIAMK